MLRVQWMVIWLKAELGYLTRVAGTLIMDMLPEELVGDIAASSWMAN